MTKIFREIQRVKHHTKVYNLNGVLFASRDRINKKLVKIKKILVKNK